MADDVRLPGLSHRTTIVGRTGSGKTRFGAWLLSRAQFDEIPFVIIDHKREGLFSLCDRIKFINGLQIPAKPGLYIMQPDVRSETHDEMLDAWLHNVLDHENIGIYIDEGYSLRQHSKAFRAVLTQGRSKHIPIITLSQRPSQISRFAFTEADFFAFFQLSLEDDRKTAQSFAPKKRIDLDKPLPPYYSHWYDVAKDQVTIFQPVPSDDEILDVFDARLAPKRKVF